MTDTGATRRPRGLWFGLLGGPLAWVLEILLVYYTSSNCVARTPLLIGGTVVAALLALGAGAVSWRISQQVDQSGVDAPALPDRLEFYATGGIYISLLSLLVVLMVLLTALILGSSCG